ncbi:hypothetical protein ACFV6B_34680 [Streptomyces microflavus]
MSGLAAGEAVLRTAHPWFTGIEGPMTKSPTVSSVAISSAAELAS